MKFFHRKKSKVAITLMLSLILGISLFLGYNANKTSAASYKPAEVPEDIWQLAIKVDKEFNKDGDFAYLLCAVMKKESSFGRSLNGGSPSAGDGLMQVEPNTRAGNASKFKSRFGHTYDHSGYLDQVRMGAMILDAKIQKFGSIYDGLLHYNGGDNWYPGATDSYGRTIYAEKYAKEVYDTYKNYGGGKSDSSPKPAPEPTPAPKPTPSPTPDNNSKNTSWSANTSYQRGDIVTYKGVSYKCIQSHTSLSVWAPPIVPALWAQQ
jgi:hypothetical protein